MADYDSDLAYIGLVGNLQRNGSIAWSWEDGTIANYTNFSPTAPHVNSSAYAVLMNPTDGTWWLSDMINDAYNNKTFHNAVCMYHSDE